MADIVLFHSVLGLRDLEREAAGRLAAAGHRVTVPDLFEGETAATFEEGFALKDRIGRETVMVRAREATADVAAEAVLAGFSFGGAVAASLLAERRNASGLLLLHGIAGIPAGIRTDLPIAVHLADPDPFEPADEVEGWRHFLQGMGLKPEMHVYPGGGHLFTDASLPGYRADHAERLWQRVLAFLDRL